MTQINSVQNFLNLPIGENFPDIVECVIEIAKDTNVKYEYDEELHVFRLDRCLLSSMNYPASYGFIPQTHGDDGDALDVLVYNTMPLMTGTVVKVRIVGVLDMTDGGKKDYKFIGIPLFNPNGYRSIHDIDPLFLKVAKNFFLYYKTLEHKETEIGEWMDYPDAYKIIHEGHEEYKRLYPELF